MAVVFWVSLGVVAYTYVGYFVVLVLLRGLRSRPVHAAPATPALSVIVPVHNAGSRIGAKLDNLLASDYPREAMQIIVVSDGSTDDTVSVVNARADEGVTLLALSVRGGKEVAQRAALAHATGDICVFTDVAARIEPDGLRRIVEPFADPTVGAVTGHNIAGAGSAERTFIGYDMMLRELESALGSVVGLSGAFSALRRELCDVWPEDVPSDFYMMLVTVLRGYRGVYARRATVRYGVVHSLPAEFQRKVRTVQRGLAALMRVPRVLLPWRTGVFALQVFSHKLLRWCVPFFLALALASNIALSGSAPYASLLLVQLVAYAVAAAALLRPRLQAFFPFRLLGFFIVSNAAVVVAWLRYWRQGGVQVWQPSVR